MKSIRDVLIAISLSSALLLNISELSSLFPSLGHEAPSSNQCSGHNDGREIIVTTELLESDDSINSDAIAEADDCWQHLNI
jgi:hypothetical protein